MRRTAISSCSMSHLPFLDAADVESKPPGLMSMSFADKEPDGDHHPSPSPCTELRSMMRGFVLYMKTKQKELHLQLFLKDVLNYLVIFVTTPAPTVRPPSRIAKLRPCSIAIGCRRVTLNVNVSPGMTISLSAGSSTSPVTSVVRK